MNVTLLHELTARLVRAAEQLPLPGTDVKRDMSKWRPESRYTALEDDDLPADERQALEAERAEHIDRVVSFLNKRIKLVAEQETEYKTSSDYADKIFRETDADQYVDALKHAIAGRRRGYQVFRIAIDALGEDLIVDAMKALAESSDSRGDVVISQQSDDTSEVELREGLLHNIEEAFDDLIDGLGKDEIEQVAADIDSATWKPRYNRGQVDGYLEVELSFTVYWTISNGEALAEKLQDMMDADDDGGDDANNLLEQPETRALPPWASADQLALLRMFDLRGVDSIKSQDLRRDPLARLPYVKDLLDRHKALTRELVLETPAVRPENVLSSLQALQKVVIKKFTMGVQVIWERPNMSFIVGLPIDKFADVFGGPMADETKRYIATTDHPTVDRRHLTVGWVRFTEFGQDVWIDEVQTDLMRGKGIITMPEQQRQQLDNVAQVSRYLLEQFVRELRARGYQRFYMPDLQVKKDEYNVKPPPSVYTDVPARMRFRQEDVRVDDKAGTIQRVADDKTVVESVDKDLDGAQYYERRLGAPVASSTWAWRAGEPQYGIENADGTFLTCLRDGSDVMVTNHIPEVATPTTFEQLPEAVQKAWRDFRQFRVVLPDGQDTWQIGQDGGVHQVDTNKGAGGYEQAERGQLPADGLLELRGRLLPAAYRKFGMTPQIMPNTWVLASRITDVLDAQVAVLSRLLGRS